MERAAVVKDEIFEQKIHFLAIYLETKNSCLVLLSENEDKLGTLAIGLPKPKNLLGMASSSIILGEKNSISARMFAEYLATQKGKIAMVSIYLKTLNETQAGPILKKLLERVIHGQREKEGTPA